MVLPGLGAAKIFLATPMPEDLVEGHTVFTTIEPIARNTTAIRFAAAVAVLVREFRTDRSLLRAPGVLWFNDQYLTDPSNGNKKADVRIRYPCGSVLAVNAGDPAPSSLELNMSNYRESYFITDPAGAQWYVDKWIVNGTKAWSVAINGNQARANATTDDADCGKRSSAGFDYNAVLYFWLEDLNVTGKKDHRVPSADVNGCQNGVYNYKDDVNEWPCPADDDDAEGNSHPYNPGRDYSPLGGQNSTRAGGHGGSADCDPLPGYDANCHATSRIDIYYRGIQPPSPRNVTFYDTQGSNAPYYCEEDLVCNRQEWNDRVFHNGGSTGLPVGP